MLMEETDDKIGMENDPLQIEVLKLTNKHDGTVRYATTRSKLRELLQLNEQSISRVLGVLKTEHMVNTKQWVVEYSKVRIDERFDR